MLFNDLAYERLSRTAPDLLGYVVSFIDLTQDIPETYGVKLGVFVVNTGGSVFYIPVISKGGTLYPIDSIFDSANSQFFPLTPKLIEKIVHSNEMNIGKGVRMPGNVITNPSVRQLIEPPRTGKYAYASQMSEVMAIAPDMVKKAFAQKLASDINLARGLRDLGFDVADMLATLNTRVKVAEEAPVNVGVRVITEGENLPDAVIQQIIERGYGFIGHNPAPTFITEYDARNDGYTNLSNAQPGNVYEVVMIDGSTKVGFVPPRMRGTNAVDLGNEKSVSGMYPVFEQMREKGASNLVIFDDGSYTTHPNPVIRATTLGTMQDILYAMADNQMVVDIDDIINSDKVMMITPTAWVGPLDIHQIYRSEAGVTLKVCDGIIHYLPNMHGDLDIQGKNIYVGPRTAFLRLKGYSSKDVETDPVAASRKRNDIIMNLMAPMKIGYDGLEYSINHQVVGDEAALARSLVEARGISKVAFENIVDKLTPNTGIEVYMSKEANIMNNQLNDIDSYGDEIPPGEDNVLPQEGDKNFNAVQTAVGTGDKSIVESTIIAEFINDPNMMETVSTYLPIIKEALDKLGRTIFLVRLNVNNLSDSIEPEYLSNLMISLRNTYKMLGDSYMKLEGISSLPPVEEGEF